MATSGTVGLTQLNTAKLIEHAFRRCKLNPSQQTAEDLDIARSNLYLLLVSLAGRGLNLWCIDQPILGLTPGKVIYPMPRGTLSISKVIFNRPSLVETVSVTPLADGIEAELTESATIRRIGISGTFSIPETLIVSTSENGISWTARHSVEVAEVLSPTTWIDLPEYLTSTWFRVTTATPSTIQGIFLASQFSSIPLGIWDKDQYAYNSHLNSSGIVTNFFFDKLIVPQLRVWPAPDQSADHLTVWRQRTIQDVGSLTEDLEVPVYWKEAIIWQLAQRIAFENPHVGGEVVSIIAQMAPASLLEAESQENDGSGMKFNFSLSTYTRW